VLHMLHERVGEEGWWRGVRTYLERHALGTVTTHDLEAAFEGATGADLGDLFDQFVYGAGYPELKVRWEYQAAAGLVRIEVRQAQALEGGTGLFSAPVEVALLPGGQGAGAVAQGVAAAPVIRRVPLLARTLQDISLPSPTRPATVVFD